MLFEMPIPAELGVVVVVNRIPKAEKCDGYIDSNASCLCSAEVAPSESHMLPLVPTM